MDKLKQNGFWVGLALVLILIVGGFVVFVMGEWGLRDKAARDLKKLNGELLSILEKQSEIPSQRQIKAYNDRVAALAKDLSDCRDWYKNYDEALEQWFEGLPNPPQPGAFKALYDTLCVEMVKQIEAAGIHHGRRPLEGVADPLFAPAIGTGPAGGVSGIQWAPVDGANALPIKEIQKRFWICQRITQALLAVQQESPRSIAALEEIRFAPGLKGPPGEEYPGWPAQPFELPGKYGTVLTCGIRVELTHAVVPAFLKLLLDTEGPGHKLLANLRGVRLTPVKPLPDKIEETITVEPGENADQLRKKREEELKAEWSKPKPIRLYVTYEVFDFDTERLVKPFEPLATAN